MSKAYIITAVDHGDSVDGKARTLGAYFSREEAQKALEADMDNYIRQLKEQGAEATETELAVWSGDSYGCEWKIEEVEIQIPMTGLQKTQIEEMACLISEGFGNFEGYASSLSDDERTYLRTVLETKYNHHMGE